MRILKAPYWLPYRHPKQETRVTLLAPYIGETPTLKKAGTVMCHYASLVKEVAFLQALLVAFCTMR